MAENINSRNKTPQHDLQYRILYLGPEHSYCHQAAIKVIPDILELLCTEVELPITEDDIFLLPIEKAEESLHALEVSSNVFSIVPLSNSELGDVYQFMPFYKYQIISSVPIEVEFWLCNQDGRIDSIQSSATKNEAYQQVSDKLLQLLPDVTRIDASSTSKAAEMARDDPKIAAVCSPDACKNYNLKKVYDLGTKITTFGVFRNEPRIIQAPAHILSKMDLLLRGGNLYTGRVPDGGRQAFAQRLTRDKEPLRVKWGIDPIYDSLHLGHFSNLLKLADFKGDGHQVVVVLGTFTGKVGDPSGNLEQRTRLDHVELKENAVKIKKQIIAVLEDGVDFLENDRLTEPLTIEGLLKWGYAIDVRLLNDRQDFKQRMESNRSLSLSEFLYALFQAHDSIQIEAEVEVGGMDQIYNCTLTRDVMTLEGITPEFVLLVKLLPGIDGTAKMSSFKGNDIKLSESRDEIRRKLLGISNTKHVIEYLRLLTRIPGDQIENWESSLNDGALELAEIREIMAECVLQMLPESLQE